MSAGETAGSNSSDDPVSGESRASVFASLEATDAAGRVELLLALVTRGNGSLDLSVSEGLRAVLDGIDLSRAALEVRLEAIEGAEPPAWWDAEARGLSFREAKLSGAKLAGAVLRGANLNKADLAEATLGAADLRGAKLEEANLSRADLAGADLRLAALGNADLTDAMLEDTKLRRAGLRFAKLRGAALDGADLRGADLWAADLTGATLVGADLRGATLREAKLAGADLSRALLRNTDLGAADLTGATLTGADLRGAQASSTRFTRAVLRDARLDRVDLSSCNLAHVHLQDATLSGTRLRVEQLGGVLGEELAHEYGDARKGYLGLERFFQDSGDPGAASWAYRRRRRMQKAEALKAAEIARHEKRYKAALGDYALYASDQLVEWLCDYGESAPRVLLAMFGVYLAFTLIYGLTGSVVREVKGPLGSSMSVPTHDPLDLAIFSLMAITAPGNAPSGMEPRNDWVILLSGIESLFGVMLTGLLGFILGNLVRR